MAKRNNHLSSSKVRDSSKAEPPKVSAGIEELTYRKLSEQKDITVRSLVAILTRELGYKSDRIISRLIQLQAEGKIKLFGEKPKSLFGYAFSAESIWFPAALLATILSFFSIYITSGLVIYLRYLFGGLLILFLPGYSLVQFLFPRPQDMEDSLTRIALSIGLSLALVPILALGLNYTPYGIRLFPIALTLCAFTIVFLFLGVAKKYRYQKMSNEI